MTRSDWGRSTSQAEAFQRVGGRRRHNPTRQSQALRRRAAIRVILERATLYPREHGLSAALARIVAQEPQRWKWQPGQASRVLTLVRLREVVLLSGVQQCRESCSL